MQKLIITSEKNGQRLDKFLKDAYGLPFGKISQLCRKGNIRLDGSRVKANAILTEGQELKIPNLEVVAESQKTNPKQTYVPTKAELKAARSMIMGEDDALIWLNKPADIPVQAGTGHVKSIDRLMSALYPDAPPKLVHRLDKATTGLLILAKTTEAAQKMSAAFKNHKLQKTYVALLSGRLHPTEGIIEAGLEKAGTKGHEKVLLSRDGKRAVTEYILRQSFGKALHLVELQPKTGRMHQLRVHTADMLKCPIVGDWKYGGEKAKIKGDGIVSGKMYLHAESMTLTHPETGKEITLTAPLAPHFNKLLNVMEMDG